MCPVRTDTTANHQHIKTPVTIDQIKVQSGDVNVGNIFTITLHSLQLLNGIKIVEENFAVNSKNLV